MAVPTLDLASQQEGELVQQLRAACTSHGFFLLTGHGVPQPEVDAALEQLRLLFGQPADVKRRIALNEHAKGYQPFGAQVLDIATQRSVGDTKETWACMDESLSAPADGRPFHSPNQWPDAALLPQFRPVMERLVASMKALRDSMNRLLAAALGQPADFFAPHFARPLDMLRGFHYHDAAGSRPDEGRLGAGAHTDWGHLTYLATDGTPGLQVLHEGQWVDVPHVPGAFVCNVADLLQLWSGGAFQSSKHRVVVAPKVHRYSLAFFTVPDYDAWVEPLTPSAAAPSAEPRPLGGGRAAGTTEGAAGGAAVVLGPDGCSLATGARVRVLDYINAKYRYHFGDAGTHA